MKRFISFLSLSLIIFMAACEKDYFAPPPVLDLATPVSFSKDVMPIFQANCYGSGCHDKGVPPNLTASSAYDDLTMSGYVDTTNAEGSKLYMRMTAASNPMPPKGKLSGELTNKILAWIKQGAQNN